MTRSIFSRGERGRRKTTDRKISYSVCRNYFLPFPNGAFHPLFMKADLVSSTIGREPLNVCTKIFANDFPANSSRKCSLGDQLVYYPGSLLKDFFAPLFRLLRQMLRKRRSKGIWYREWLLCFWFYYSV